MINFHDFKHKNKTDSINRFLTEENLAASPAKAAASSIAKQMNVSEATASEMSDSSVVNMPQPYQQWIARESEQTPSESNVTTDDENEANTLQVIYINLV